MKELLETLTKQNDLIEKLLAVKLEKDYEDEKDENDGVIDDNVELKENKTTLEDEDTETKPDEDTETKPDEDTELQEPATEYVKKEDLLDIMEAIAEIKKELYKSKSEELDKVNLSKMEKAPEKSKIDLFIDSVINKR
jgi:hypothetical protein